VHALANYALAADEEIAHVNFDNVMQLAVVIFGWGGTGFSAELRVAVIALPSPRSFPTYLYFILL